MSNLTPFEQVAAHERVSNKYAFVSTEQITNDLHDLGWEPFKSNAVRSRKYAGFQKHMVRFNNPNYKIGDDDIEIVLINSHNGLNSVRLMLGMFRSLCLNGLVVGEQFESYRIRHTGYAKEKLTTVVNSLTSQVEKLKTVVATMKARQMETAEIKELSLKAVFLRIDSNDPRNLMLDEDTIYRPQRDGDAGTDLWTVFNVLQEGLIKGGIKFTYEAVNKDNKVRVRHGSTRRLRNIDTTIDINQQLFDLANAYLQAA